jgi:hypothetical protein
MLTRHFRQAFRSPLPALASGFRFWWEHGARVRRARALCQCGDGLRLRRPPGWERRSLRLYRLSAQTLGELAGAGEAVAEDPALSARRALRRATFPYRAFFASLAKLAVLLAAAALLVLLAGNALSSGFSARLFPRDLAAGRPWNAGTGELGMPASGVGPASDGPLFFHTREVRNPTLEIDLDGEHLIRSVLVENRADCCQERALPLNVEIWNGSAWQLIAQRRTPFKVWKYDVGPVRAGKIRFRHPGTNYLHLKRISVFGQ